MCAHIGWVGLGVGVGGEGSRSKLHEGSRRGRALRHHLSSDNVERVDDEPPQSAGEPAGEDAHA